MEIFTKILAVFLTAAVLLSTTACEKKAKIVTDADREEAVQATETSSDLSFEPVGGVLIEPGSVLSMDAAYYSNIGIVFPEAVNGVMRWVVDFCLYEDRIIFLMQEEAELTKEDKMKMADVDTVPEAKHTLLYYDFDGNLKNEIKLEMDSMNNSQTGYTYVKSMFINAAGDVSIFAIQRSNESNNEVCKIFSVDAQGQLRDNPVTLDALNSKSGDIGTVLTLLGIKENLYAIARQGSNDVADTNSKGFTYEVLVYDTNGIEIFRISSSELDGEAGEFEEKILTDGTSVYVHELQKQMIYKVDIENQNLIPVTNVSQNISMAGNGDLCVSDVNGAYLQDLTTGDIQMLFSWTDLDFSGSHTNSGITVLSENRLLMQGISNSTHAQFYILKKEDGNPNQEKETIYIGGFNISNRMFIQDAVSTFNQINPSYRAEIVEYNRDMQSMNNEDEQINAMNMQILSGDTPDVFIEMNSHAYENSIPRYAVRGIFSDLLPFVENDTDFQKDEYFENILMLPEMNGSLFYMIPYFTLDGFLGKTETLGNRTGWTFSEFETFAEQLPEGTQLLGSGNAMRLLRKLTAGHLTSLIDYSSAPANCRFDNETFRKILQFCQNYYHAAGNQESSMSSEEGKRILYGELALSVEMGNIGCVTEFTYSWENIQAPVRLVGYPSESSQGPVCTPEISAAIFTDSPYQEAGWEFLKVLLSEELQTKYATDIYDLSTSLPVNKAALAYAGEDVLIALTSGRTGRMPREIPPALVEDWHAALQEIAASSDMLAVNDVDILRIVEEESQAFFAGQKPMDDTIAIIQSKVATYLNEQ